MFYDRNIFVYSEEKKTAVADFQERAGSCACLGSKALPPLVQEQYDRVVILTVD